MYVIFVIEVIEIRLAVCDPNFKFLNAVRTEIEEIDKSISVFCYPSFEKLNQNLSLVFDAILINTEIDSDSGLDIAVNIKRQYSDTEIIFVTQYGEKYAQMIFYNVDVMRPYAYFVKPINRVYFHRIIHFLEQAVFEKNIGNIIIRDSSGDTFSLPLSNILYIEHGNRLSSIYDKKGNRYVCRRTLSQFESHLPERLFCYSSKSCIVNLSEVEQMSGNEILMSNGDKLYASRNYRSNFLNEFMQCMEIKQQFQKETAMLI